MNRMSFIYKFIFNNKSVKYLKFSSYFPLFGTILGIVIVLLTISIMNGMEYAIFTKLKEISFPSKLLNLPSGDDFDELILHLNSKNIDFKLGFNGKVIIQNDENHRLVNINGIKDFSTFKNKIFNHKIDLLDLEISENYIYIGSALANKLQITLGDRIELFSTRINPFIGIPYNKTFTVTGIYDLEILDYDQKYVFTDYQFLTNFLESAGKVFYLNESLGLNEKKNILKKTPNVKIKNWDSDHYSFISAMKVEKIIYSLVGILIIGISAFTLLSMMSLSVMQKISQIGILRALGTSEHKIMNIFLFQALATWFISSSTGIILTLVIIKVDKKINFISNFFNNNLMIDFPLMIKLENIILVVLFTLLLLILSAIYPSIKASKLNVINSLGHKK